MTKNKKPKTRVLNAIGNEIDGHAHGNNAAFLCFCCRYPVLASGFSNQYGNNKNLPTTCERCVTKYYLDIQDDKEGNERLFYIHRLA